MSEIQLGKGSKNYGVVNTEQLKGGIRREQLKTEEQKSIFDAADTDKNGVLDANEMQQFTEQLQDAAGNEKLSKREAKKFLKSRNLKDVDKKELFKFVNELSQSSENIAESKVVEQNGQKTILVTYKDGSQETINPDKTSQIMSTDQNNAVTTKFFDENRKLTKEQIVQENGDTETTDIENDLPVQKTIVTNNGSKTAVINYEDGVEIKQSVTEGSVKSDYTYVDGKPVLTQKIEDLGNDVARTTDYTYNEDGTVTTNITEPGKSTVQQLKDGKLLSEVITEGDKKTERLYKDDNTTRELVTDGENKTATIYNSETGKRLEQAKLVNGKQYAVKYDGEGNTEGIIVQNGESISSIAKKFGVSAKDLMEANQDKLKGKNNKYFSVGDEIKIPRELDADAKALQGRKSAEEAKAEFARDEQIRQQKRAAARERDAAYRKLGLVNYKGAGEKVTGDYWKNNKKTSSVQLTKIGNATHGRTIARDKQGKIYVVAHNGVILKDSWVEISAHRKTVKSGNRWYAVEGKNADGYARTDVIDASGNTRVMSHDNKILRKDYLEAHKAYVNKPKSEHNNTVSGQKDVTYVKDSNGKVWYFNDKTGRAIVKDGYRDIVNKESDYVANKLHKAADGIGTDTDLLKEGVNNIYSRDILVGVNNRLEALGYKGDVQKMPVEALILAEERSDAVTYLKPLIQSGAMTLDEQARTVKREIEYEVHGGILGYTDTQKLNNVLQLVETPELRKELEAQFKQDHPYLKENEGSIVRAYIAGDGFSAQEVDQFDANWVKTGAYAEARYVYQVDENGNIAVDKNGRPIIMIDEGDQAHRNGVIGRLVFDYQDKEALNKGLEVVNDDPNSFDYQYLDKRAGEEVAKDPKGKYQSRFTNQDNIQRYLAGFHSDAETGKVDVGNVSASNTILFKGEKPPRIQAEEALYNAKNGDYSESFNSMEPQIYSAMAELIAKGDVKGVKNMNDLYKKAINSSEILPNDKTKIMVGAIISGQVDFTDKEITNLCIGLMHSIDTHTGDAESSWNNEHRTNIANLQKEQLRAILLYNPQIMSAVKARVHQEDFSYTILDSKSNEKVGALPNTVSTKESHLKFLEELRGVAKEEIFYDENGKQITDSARIEEIKASNMQYLNGMRLHVAELEREFKKGVDTEGLLSDSGNFLVMMSGVGTDRGDVKTEYTNAKIRLQQLEAAAQGRLRDSNGKVISFQTLVKESSGKLDSLENLNSKYKTSIAYGKGAAITLPVALATSAFGGTAIGAGITATVVTFGLNELEATTSHTGDTVEAREQNAKDSLVTGLTAGIGAGQMKYIYKLANNMGTTTRTGIRLAATVTADTATGVGAEYVSTGSVSKESLLSNLLVSAAGNSVGVKSLGAKADKTGINSVLPKTSDTPVLNQASSNGKATPSSVPVGKGKGRNIQQEVSQAVSNPDISGEDLARIRHQADGISNRDVRRDVQKKVDKAAENLSPQERASFDAANRANAQNNIDHIFEKHSVLNDGDTRVMNEYIKNTDDPDVLKDLREKLTEKEYTYGGVTANYNRLRKAIDDRLASLNPAPVKSNIQQHDDVVAMLNEKAQTGKGLNENDFKQVTDYLETITDEAQFKELTGLLNGKKMTSVQKKQIKELLSAKNSEIKASHIPDTAEPSKTPVAADEGVEVPTHNSSNTVDEGVEVSTRNSADAVDEGVEVSTRNSADAVDEGVEVPTRNSADTVDEGVEVSTRNSADAVDEGVEVSTRNSADAADEGIEVKPEKVANDANAIQDAEIPAQHRDMWKSCKSRIDTLTQEIANLSDKVNPRELLVRGKALLADLKTIGQSVTGSVRSKIQNLYSDLRTMLNNVKVKFQNNRTSSAQKPFKLITSEKEAMDYFKNNIEERAIIWDGGKKIEERSMRNCTDGKPYYMSVEDRTWLYEIHNSSGTGNINADYSAQRKMGTPWKIHIYADSPQEWANAAQVALPILRENKLHYKTLSAVDKNAFLNLEKAFDGGIQKGKAFTVYFRSKEEFTRIAHTLDAAFQKSGLRSSGTVVNERQIGNSGFLSYRNEQAERGVSYNVDGVEDPYLKSLGNADGGVQNGNTSVELSDEIKNNISPNTQTLLKKLEPGRELISNEGDKIYTFRNNNGKIEITNIINRAAHANGNTSVELSDEIKNNISPNTQTLLKDNLKEPGQELTFPEGGKRYIFRNNNGKIEITAQGEIKPATHAETAANLNSIKSGKFENLSEEISSTFGHKTCESLSKLKPNHRVGFYRGDTHYVVENINGKIEIISKTPKVEVNFDIPLSNRTPAGKNNKGISMNDALTKEQKQVYNSSYQAFMDSKDNRIIHTHTNTLSTDNLLHGTTLEALIKDGGVLDNGLVPRELSGKTAASYADGSIPDTLTPLCTDTWDVRGNYSIRDYFDSRSNHWKNDGEANFLPNSNQTRSPFVLVLDTKSIDPTIMKNSFEVNNNGQSVLFEHGNMSRGHNYPTHRALPIGAPSNSIEKIIVDTRIVDGYELNQLRSKIFQNDLDIKLYDLDGNEIWY